MKVSNNFSSEVWIEDRLESLFWQGLFRGMGAEQVDGEFPEGGKVLRRVPVAYGKVILSEHDIQGPVATIFNSPMRPDGGEDLLRAACA